MLNARSALLRNRTSSGNVYFTAIGKKFEIIPRVEIKPENNPLFPWLLILF
jgi:hypothetical protein